MRFHVKRLLGVSALSLFFGLASCSGQQQAEEGVEVSEQGDGQAAENQAGENNAEGSDNQAANQAEDGGGGGSQDASAPSETADAGGNGSESELQEIISEMNGQPAGETTAAGGEPETTMPPEAMAEAPAAPVAGGEAAAPSEVPAAAPTAAPVTTASSSTGTTSNVMPFQPGGTPAGNGLPEIGSKMAYIVEQGDTLGKISKKVYGMPNRWKELASLSGLSNPSRIFPGDVVYYTLDENAVSFAQAYEGTQRMEVQVGQGETLATVARKVYGNGKAWRAIWRQNDKIDNPDVVPPGTVVYYLPSGAATAAAKIANKSFIETAKKSNNRSNNKSLAKNKSNFKNQKIKQKNSNAKIFADSHSIMNFSSSSGSVLFLNI